MKTREPSSNVYLPPEVLTRILANLPAKSLLRFRCVCKSWCSTIDDPYFVNMHSKRCNSNNKTLKSTEVLVLEGLNNFVQSGCLLTLRKAGTLCKIGDIFTSSDESYGLHGSCYSLILISRGPNYLYKGMRICNPSIRKSLLVIPDCPLIPWFNCNVTVLVFTYALGFASQSKDFKVIAVSFMLVRGVTLPKTRLAVYTPSDQQWVVRDNGFNLDGLSSMQLFGIYYFCDGAAHWLGTASCEDSSNQDDKPNHLVSLDFDTESFTFLNLPDALDEDTTSRYLFLLGESIAIFYISHERLSIWVLKQESEKREWTSWFSGPSSVNGCDLFYYFRGSTPERVLYCEGDSDDDGDGGYLVYEGKSYNIATGQLQWLQKPDNPLYRESFVLYYESLVLCKGYRVEDMATSPIRWDK